MCEWMTEEEELEFVVVGADEEKVAIVGQVKSLQVSLQSNETS